MKNSLKIIFLPIILFIFSTSLVIIPNNLKTINDFLDQFVYSSYAFKFFLVVAILIIFIINHLISHLGTVKIFNQFDKIRSNLINEKAIILIKKYNNKGITLRFNIFIAERKLFICRFPFIFQKKFKTIYHCNMENCKDRDIGLTTKQGVSGLAYRDPEGKHKIVDLENTKETFNLDKKQLERTAGIKFIISTPILKWDHETGKFTDKTIGVINIDSRENSFNEFKEKIRSDEILKNCNDIAKTVSMMY